MKNMEKKKFTEIYPGIEIVDLALYIREHKTLIITDTQIGLEENLNKQGILIPRFQYKDIIKALDKIFDKAGIENIDKVVINGDVKHEFGEISRQEWRDVLNLLGYLQEKSKKIILVKGNHDTILGPLAEKKGLQIKNHYNIGNITILHGHKIFPRLKLNKIIIIGHEHPAVSLKKGSRVERFRCYLKGKWKNHVLIVQPSLNFVRIGYDVLQEKLLSQFLQHDINNFDVYIVEDKIYYFGKIKDLRQVK